MENSFLYYQKCKKMNCNFFSYFKIFLNNYDNDGECVLDETQKRLDSFLCPFCEMVTFLDFEKAANKKAVILLKRCHFLVRLRRQIHDERI